MRWDWNVAGIWQKSAVIVAVIITQLLLQVCHPKQIVSWNASYNYTEICSCSCNLKKGLDQVPKLREKDRIIELGTQCPFKEGNSNEPGGPVSVLTRWAQRCHTVGQEYRGAWAYSASSRRSLTVHSGSQLDKKRAEHWPQADCRFSGTGIWSRSGCSHPSLLLFL